MKKIFISIFLLLQVFILQNKNLYAQIKLNESFDSVEFPPGGWSVSNVQQGEGEWSRTFRTSRTGTGCAVSNYTPQGSDNFLITKRFIPSAGDSLIFFFRQTFWNIYKDTFNVYISTADSLIESMTTRLLHLHDGLNYISPLSYGRYSISLNSYAGQTVWIGFQHVNLDGDNVRLDDIKVGSPAMNEVGVVSNIFPKGFLGACSFLYIIPKAEIKNFGLSNQVTPFDIKYVISGPLSFTFTKSDTLAAGHSKEIWFDSSFIFADTGTYNVKIFTCLPGDQNPGNDTIYSSFNIVQSNYGGGNVQNGEYFFSNSTDCASNAQSSPDFCWKDTSGSVNLILNGSDLSGGLLTGNTDDGYFSLANIFNNGIKFKFFENEYDSIFISTNGAIGLTKNDVLLSPFSTGVDSILFNRMSFLAAIWTDFDFSSSEVVNNRLCYKVIGNQLLITFSDAPLKSGGATDYISFQISLETGNSMLQNSRIIFQYDFQETGEGFISKYYSNTLPSHFTGLKNGDGNKSLIYRLRDSLNVIAPGALFNESVAIEFGPTESELDNKCSQISMKVFLEAISPERDTISILLRDAIPPHRIVETKKVYLDTSGSGECLFTFPDDKSAYYIVVKHRNSLETWSREAGEIFSSFVLDYDFTTDSAKAFGSNMKVINGRAYVYTGDVNQDGTVDVSDMGIVSNDAYLSQTGYIPTDINGDYIVDITDLAYCDNNSYNYVTLMLPSTAPEFLLIKRNAKRILED